MKTRPVGIRLGVIGWIALALLGGCLSGEQRERSTDARQRLALAPAERDKVLAEMRMMLGSIGGTLHALVANDMAGLEKAARASGMAMAVGPHLEKQLPPQFLELGERTHRGFDQLAYQARAGGKREHLTRGLAGLTDHCVACHAIYRLDKKR